MNKTLLLTALCLGGMTLVSCKSKGEAAAQATPVSETPQPAASSPPPQTTDPNLARARTFLEQNGKMLACTTLERTVFTLPQSVDNLQYKKYKLLAEHGIVTLSETKGAGGNSTVTVTRVPDDKQPKGGLWKRSGAYCYGEWTPIVVVPAPEIQWDNPDELVYLVQYELTTTPELAWVKTDPQATDMFNRGVPPNELSDPNVRLAFDTKTQEQYPASMTTRNYDYIPLPKP